MNDDLTIEYVPITDLYPHPDNPNSGDLDAIAESIQTNGLYSPLIVQKSTGYILAGNHRYMVLMQQGIASVPVVYLDIVDEVKARKIMLADNRTNRLGHDDPGMIAEILESLVASDAGTDALLGTGYSAHDYQSIIEAANEPLDLDAVQHAGQEDVDVADSVRFKQRFWVEPEIDGDDKVYRLVVTRQEGKAITARDMNTILTALGVAPKTADELGIEYGVSSWGGH